MKTLYTNGKIYDTKAKSFADGEITVENGIIVAADIPDKVIDLGGAYVMPGLVDVHTHGRAGFAGDDAGVKGIYEMAKSYGKAGTTSFMATLMTVPADWYPKAISDIKTAAARQDEALDGANIIGIHFEGRYLNEKKKGAHDPALLSALDADEIAGFINQAIGDASPLEHFHITCAPELPGGEAFVKRAVSLGATVGIGHSAATYDQCIAAMEWGATAFTHLYNAMGAFAHREPSCVGAGLSTDAYTELISDGYHVHPGAVKTAYLAKSHDKLVLITDSLPAAGLEPGVYRIGTSTVDTRNGKIGYCPDGVTINGSIIDLFTGMKNFMKFTGITLEEAIPYATVNPARMVGADNIVGSLEPGKYADFIILGSDRASIDSVYVRGNLIK